MKVTSLKSDLSNDSMTHFLHSSESHLSYPIEKGTCLRKSMNESQHHRTKKLVNNNKNNKKLMEMSAQGGDGIGSIGGEESSMTSAVTSEAAKAA